MEPLNRLTYLFKQYDNILGWYHQAEAKATLLHAINGALVAAVNVLGFVGAEKFHDLHLSYSRGIVALLAVTAICVVASYCFMLRAVWARHHGREVALSDKEKLWFFGHVASMPLETYKRLLEPFVEADIEATMVAQNHILSCNVTTKFDALNRAISFTIAAIVVFFIVGVVYALAAIGGGGRTMNRIFEPRDRRAVPDGADVDPFLDASNAHSSPLARFMPENVSPELISFKSSVHTSASRGRSHPPRD